MRASYVTFLIAYLLLFWAASGTLGPAYGREHSLKVHGFLSQGVLYSSHNNYYGESTEFSHELTELGINFRYAPLPATVFSAQLVSRRAGELYDSDPRIDYAFLEHTFAESTSGRLGVRLGRDKIPIGFFNETRDVPMTRPGILLPQSIYVEGLGIRDFYIGVDGGSLFWDWYTAQGTVQLDIGAAYPAEMEEETQNAFLGREYPGDLELTSGQNIRLLYEHGGGIWRLAATYSRVRTEYAALDTALGAGEDIGDGEMDVDALVLSVERNWQRWRLIAEGTVRSLQPSGFEAAPLPLEDVTEAGYYLQGNYRLARKWDAFLRYDTHWDDASDRDGTKRAAQLQRAAARAARLGKLPEAAPEPHRFFQHQWTAGVGWEVTSAWLLRAEWHHIHGTALTPQPVNPEFAEGGGASRWNLFALQASYQF